MHDIDGELAIGQPVAGVVEPLDLAVLGRHAPVREQPGLQAYKLQQATD